MSGPPALEVRELCLRFGAVEALDDVTFEVAEGELFALIGPNGAGKTSLFNLFSRTYAPTSGAVRYFGQDLLRLRAHQLAGAGMARTFQNLGLFMPLTALDNVLVGRNHAMRSGALSTGLHLARASREERQNREMAMDALMFVDAGRVANIPVGALPYGMQKRVEIARALAMRPKLLLLDEPVAGMTKEERERTGNLLGKIAEERAVVVVEHDMDFLRRFANTVTVMHEGKILCEGSPDEVQTDPRVKEVYLGRSERQPAATGTIHTAVV